MDVTHSSLRYALRATPLTILVGSVAVAVLMSTEYLFQPFVWRNWPWDEVMIGWLEVVRDRTVVALAIGVPLIAASRFAARALRSRLILSQLLELRRCSGARLVIHILG